MGAPTPTPVPGSDQIVIAVPQSVTGLTGNEVIYRARRNRDSGNTHHESAGKDTCGSRSASADDAQPAGTKRPTRSSMSSSRGRSPSTSCHSEAPARAQFRVCPADGRCGANRVSVCDRAGRIVAGVGPGRLSQYRHHDDCAPSIADRIHTASRHAPTDLMDGQVLPRDWSDFRFAPASPAPSNIPADSPDSKSRHHG